jgi:GrpB-like predicted nucleotidyltransferase (UPF0157 family)
MGGATDVGAPGSAVVVDYDERWPQDFERVRADVWPAVAAFAVAVEHVGSTPVTIRDQLTTMKWGRQR